MDVEWSEAKRIAVTEAHGLDFIDVVSLPSTLRPRPASAHHTGVDGKAFAAKQSCRHAPQILE